MRIRSRVLFAVIALIILSGCAQTETETETYVEASTTVVNQSGQKVNFILFRPCGDNSQQWHELSGSEIEIGAAIKLDLTENCVDLKVMSSNKKVIGTQLAVMRKLPFRWILK